MSNLYDARGYIGAAMRFGRSVPQSVQQRIIVDYCRRNGLNFLLSATEYNVKGYTLMLDAIKENTVVMYSMYQMPADKKKRAALGVSKKIHFAAENIVYNSDVEEIFDLMDLYERNELSSTLAYLNKARLFR